MTPRAERAAVRAVASQVDDARLTLARAFPRGADDRRVDRALGQLLPLVFAGRPRGDCVRALRVLGVARPAATFDALAPLFAEAPSPEFALRLVRAHEITRQRRLVRRGGDVSLARSGSRRSQGVYYTPPDVVGFIVAQTLDPALSRLERRARQARGDGAALGAVWAELRQLAVLDPACGGGLFLLGALERVRRSYRLLAACWGAGAPAELAAPGREALRHNLFGVDLDLRALELAELLLRAEVEGEPGETPPLVGRALCEGDHLAGGPQPPRLGFSHARSFPRVFDRPDPGFDVILGNPPYAPLSDEQRERARQAGFATHDAGDLYATFVEGLLTLGRSAGRGGLIVPLSLTFSRRFRQLRERVLLAHPARWRIASFDRIPSGLFEAEVRTRTAIVLREPAPAARVETTRLRRFTAAERPQVFADLSFVDVTAVHHPRLGFPKPSSALQARWIERLREQGHRLADACRADGEHALHYKHNCYAFAVVAAELPPAFDEQGQPTEQSKYSSLRFATRAERDQALAVTAGCWLLWWWLVYGDGFDMTGSLIGGLPIDPSRFRAPQRRRLADLGEEIQRRVRGQVAYKKNSGKRIGTFDLRTCRELTDAADEVVAEALGARDLLADVRAMLTRTHGTAWAS